MQNFISVYNQRYIPQKSNLFGGSWGTSKNGNTTGEGKNPQNIPKIQDESILGKPDNDLNIFNYLKSVGGLGITLNTTEVQLQTHSFKVQQDLSFQDLTMTFIELSGSPINRWFKTWVTECIFDPKTGKWGLPQNYKVNFNLHLYDNSGVDGGKENEKRIWNFYGVFPTNVSTYELSYESQDQYNTQVTFKYDFIDEMLNGGSTSIYTMGE